MVHLDKSELCVMMRYYIVGFDACYKTAWDASILELHDKHQRLICGPAKHYPLILTHYVSEEYYKQWRQIYNATSAL